MKDENIYISELPLSQEFKNACAANGFVTLQELMSIPLDELTHMSWLTMPMLDELKSYVNRQSGLKWKEDGTGSI